MSKIMEYLTPLMQNGLHITMYIKNKIIHYDLDTQAKSGCILVDTPDGIYAKTRYDAQQLIECYEDIIFIVHSCGCGRRYFNQVWLEIFQKEGLSNPIDDAIF